MNRSSCTGRDADSGCVAVLRTWNRRPHRGLILAVGFACAACLVAGCTDARFIRHICPQPHNPKTAADTPAPDAAYRVGCPDVLLVEFPDRPDWNSVVSLDLDGRLPLGEPGSPRVEGMTLDEVRAELGKLAGVPAHEMCVELVVPRSARVYLYGPIRGRARAVPYQGPEPVIDFLKRVGGLPPGSHLSEVYVIRPNVATGERTELFQVNVPAVLLDGDMETNVRLRPSDQVYVGETRGSSFSRLLPHWLGTQYRRLVGLLPDDWWPFNRSHATAP